MSRCFRAALVTLMVGAGSSGAQLSPAHRACRDPHAAPTCGSYLLFELNAAGRIAGTERQFGPFERRPALQSWFAWDAGWMKNTSPARSLGASLQIGGSGDGVRMSLRARERLWRRRGIVIDIAAGPLMSQVGGFGGEGVSESFGATGDIGIGRARLGLLTVGGDVARHRGSSAYSVHAGGRLESRGVGVVSACAAVGGLVALAALRDGVF